MLIGEIIAVNPSLVDVLTACGMHCIGCPASQMESIEDACAVHGLDVDDVLAKLNEVGL